MKSLESRASVLIRLLAGISIALPTIVTAVDIAPPESYTAMSEIRNVAISPSGNFVAYQIFEDGDNLILVFDMTSGKVVLSSNVDESYLHSIQFVNDEFVALVYDMDPWSNRSLSSFAHNSRIDSKSPTMVARGPGTVYGRRTRFLDLKDTSVQRNYLAGANGDIVSIASDLDVIYVPWEYGALAKYTVSNGSRSPHVASGSSDTLSWFMSRDHQPLVREDFDFSKNRHVVYVYRDGEPSVLLDEEVDGRDLDVVALSPDQGSLIYLTQTSEFDRMTYHTMSLEDGARSDPLFSQYIGRVLTDSGKTAFGFERDNYPGFEYVFLNKKAEDFFRSIEKSFPGLDVRFVASNDDFEHMVVRVSKNWGTAHYLFFSNGNPQPTVIGQDNSAISSEQSMPRTLLEFKASDGRSIRAYLTMPDDLARTGNAPLLVIANGSRPENGTRRYQWLAQYFASRGFVVVEPAIRGAYYHPSFMPQSDLSWGDKYESDTNDTVQHLVDQGISDADRLCVIGIGIGGYAAMSAAARSPEKYRCIASVSGLSDLSILFARARDDRWSHPTVLSFFETVFGVSGKDKSAIKSKSPQNNVESDFPPALLMYFEGGDSIYDYSMKDMNRALKRKGVTVDLVKLPGFNVELSEYEARTLMFELLSSFVEEHL
jgi:dipeptidyl aminopeptidase/acylaminoacyl peptidase